VEFSLTLDCPQCNKASSVPFEPEAELPWISCCPECGKQFGIDSQELARQIRLFIALNTQLRESEEILSGSSIAVMVGNKEVKIPFKLLLTRFKTTFDLKIGEKKYSISTRTEL